MATEANEVNTFLYIPDMTGFTEFMASTDPQQSHMIVKEMLTWITDANILEMHISDIIGDAVFFYKTGDPPPLKDVIKQSKLIFEGFHKKLRNYGVTYNSDTRRFECIHRLSIKFIAHYGEVTLSDIENHISIIGTPVIETHKLLKNSVEAENYLLVTENYLDKCSKEPDLASFLPGKDSYEHLGEIRYRALNLTP